MILRFSYRVKEKYNGHKPNFYGFEVLNGRFLLILCSLRLLGISKMNCENHYHAVACEKCVYTGHVTELADNNADISLQLTHYIQ